VTGADLRDELDDSFDIRPGVDMDAGPVELTAASGAILPLGVAARMIGS
jgi:hypothetical protein